MTGLGVLLPLVSPLLPEPGSSGPGRAATVPRGRGWAGLRWAGLRGGGGGVCARGGLRAAGGAPDTPHTGHSTHWSLRAARASLRAASPEPRNSPASGLPGSAHPAGHTELPVLPGDRCAPRRERRAKGTSAGRGRWRRSSAPVLTSPGRERFASEQRGGLRSLQLRHVSPQFSRAGTNPPLAAGRPEGGFRQHRFFLEKFSCR